MAGPNEIGKTRLGFGASGAWAKRWFAEAKAEGLVARAVERGINHFDTASFYANGLAETRLGKILQNLGNPDVEVSTKTGTEYRTGRPPLKDFSPASIRSDTEQSLKRLNREQLDILYLHGPNNQELEGALETLQTLKREGKIKQAGICGFKPELEEAIKLQGVDIIMCPYNILDPSSSSLFGAAKSSGIRTVGIASLVPGLGQKGLARPTSPSDIWYLLRAAKHRTSSLSKPRARLQAIAARNAPITSEQLMLHFALANPAIDLVLTNTTRISHLDANISTAEAPALGADLLAELSAFHIS